MKLMNIEIDDIKPNPKQPRENFDKDKIQELSDSIGESGLIQPIVVREKGTKFQIIAGERRWRALQLLSDKKVPAVVRDVNDLEAREISLMENWHRQDLTSIEKEKMVNELWNSGKYKRRVNLAKKLGVAESSIMRLIQANEFREKNPIPDSISEDTIAKTVGLPDKERVEILERVERGDLAVKRVRDETKIQKYMKTLTPRKEMPPIQRTPTDYVTELNFRLTQSWVFLGVKIPDDKKDEMLKWAATHFTSKQKKDLLDTMRITVLSIERFMDCLK